MKFNSFAGITGASLWVGISVVLSELYAPFKNLLVSLFNHHWTGKIIIMTLLFVIIGFTYSGKKIMGYDSDDMAWYSTNGSMVVIIIFFILHYFL